MAMVRRATVAGVALAAVVSGWPSAAAAEPAPRPDRAALVDVVADRLATADVVAAVKWRSGAPVDDPVREAQVVDTAVTTGGRLGLDAARVTTVVRDQIEVGKAVQRTLIALWRTAPATAPTAPPDLTAVRPRITVLTDDLVTGLARDDAALRGPRCPADLAKAVIATTRRDHSDPLHAVALAAATRSLCR